MEQTNSWAKSWSIATSYAAIVSVLWVSASTIIGELNAPFKNWLKTSFTHHWIGKGVIAVVLFAALSVLVVFIARKNQKLNIQPALTLLVVVTVLGTLAITGFYFYEDFIKH